jgi:CopA family copper-resistance protein
MVVTIGLLIGSLSSMSKRSAMLRRKFLKSSLLLGGSAAWQSLLPAWAQSNGLTTLAGVPGLQGSAFELAVSSERSPVAGKAARHIRLNGQFPAPLLRWRDGDVVTLNIHNHLDEPTSIHWHGILLPWQMDGVPGVSFGGIAPGASFSYQFPLKQSGTYWYHSHSGLQEQSGHYGPLIIDPREPEPFSYEREYVLLLSDWTFEKPERVFSKLKKMSDTYNYQQRTLGDFFRDVQHDGLDATLAERMLWGDMRMSRTDLADVTAATYTYLVNGHSPAENWTGLFSVGERIRLRIINASSMSIFNLRIPGLPMTVVQADGQNVQPVVIDELQIGTAETYDVIVQPTVEQAFTVYAESNDRYGYARATLAPHAGMQAAIPPLRPRPLLSMKDMGMDHGSPVAAPMAVDHSQMDHSKMEHSATESAPAVEEHSAHTSVAQTALVDHSAHGANSAAPSNLAGPGVASLASNPVSRLHERPLGLENEPHRVLVYTDLRSVQPNPDQRAPTRELQLHLTANMQRYMWSFDGLKFSEVSEPIPLQLNERIRLTFVNDTMMPHPLHVHGMFFDVVTEESAYKPRKHTLVLKPGEKASVDLTVDAPGQWAFHCHLLYHMHAGMMRMFSVAEGVAS